MTVVPIAGLLGIAAMGHSQPSRSSLPGLSTSRTCIGDLVRVLREVCR